MGKSTTSITQQFQEFIEAQKLFFTATAGAQGLINLSPKGLDSFKIIDPNTVAWLNYTGSGNETAAHVLENQRMTIMFCSFDQNPLILRLYGKATFVQEGDDSWSEWLNHFPKTAGARQIFILQVEKAATSCGWGVPEYEYKGERDTLIDWAEKKGEEGIRDYWKEKNAISLDGQETGIPR